MHCLFSVYFVSQLIHVWGIFVAQHQEVYCVYTTKWYLLCSSVDCLLAGLGMAFHPNAANRESTEKHNTCQLLYIYSIPPDDGLQICPKHVKVDRRNKLRINSASISFLLHIYRDARSIKHKTS